MLPATKFAAERRLKQARVLEFRFVDVHAEGNDAGASSQIFFSSAPLPHPRSMHRPGVAESTSAPAPRSADALRPSPRAR